MNRLMCWLCSRRLVYHKGKPTFSIYVDPIGAEHKVHKFCAKENKADEEDERRRDFKEWAERGS